MTVKRSAAPPAPHADVRPTMDEIVAAAMRLLTTTLAEIHSDRRSADAVRPRMVITVAARREGYSFPSIGRHLHRDHTSAVHLARKWADLTASGHADPDTENDIQATIAIARAMAKRRVKRLLADTVEAVR